MSDIRTRFAPSPTGQIHLGNIRTAIFNWLFARHNDGTCLLRIEDTDRERSTSEAVSQLMADLDWLSLDFDEAPVYQSQQLDSHLKNAGLLLDKGAAYRHVKGEGGEVTMFRIPLDFTQFPSIRDVGDVEIKLHPDEPVTIAYHGISYAQISKKGKPIPVAACLAGYTDLQVFDAENSLLFSLAPVVDDIVNDKQSIQIDRGHRIRFRRHEVTFTDMIKGELAKPLDSLKDFVVVRADDSPIFHLANVSDDITQKISHVIRGDDHIENTYRHTLLFQALDAPVPMFAHLPMIVNEQGKPYSKRDGDAFLGDLRDHGYLPDAIFNYLTLLGWSPGDDREKMSRSEIVQAFELQRVQSSPAQMDERKLMHLNGVYMEEIPADEFLRNVSDLIRAEGWGAGVESTYVAKVAELMQSRTKLYPQVLDWRYFFDDSFDYDDAAVAKSLQNPAIKGAFANLINRLESDPFTEASVEAAIHAVTDELGIKMGKLNLPLRVAITGTKVGAGIYEVMALIGKERVLKRLQIAVDRLCD